MSSLKKNLSYLATFLATLIFTTASFACTNINVKAEDGSVVVGRTLEFGPSLNSHIITSPRDRKFQTPEVNGQPGMQWQSKYGYVYANYFGQNYAVDGMNEKGLSVGGLYMPGYTQYQTIPDGKAGQAMPYYYFIDWILGEFDSVAQLKTALNNVYVYALPMTVENQPPTVFPLHFMITDKTGQSIVVEFTKGEMQVYDHVEPIMTNSPPYDWQLTNLKNFTNLSPYATKTLKIDGFEYDSTGQGSGSVGLPGDYTPPSRFVKMDFLLHAADKAQNAQQALNIAQHIINNVDIVKGAVRGVEGSQTMPDTTQWTFFKDLTNNILYFKSYDNTTLQAINLNKLDFTPGAKPYEIPVTSQQIIIDATDKMTEVKQQEQTQQ